MVARTLASLMRLLLCLVLGIGAEVAPRLPASPWPVSSVPQEVWLLNITAMSLDQRLLALSLSGLVAQRSPEVFVWDAAQGVGLGGTPLATWHLSLVPLTAAAKHDELLDDLPGLLTRFAKDSPGGYIFAPQADEAENGPVHVAVALSGVLRAVVCTSNATAGLAEAAGLRRKLDARSLTLHEAFHRYRDLFSKKVLYNQKYTALRDTTDLAVYSRAFAMYDPFLNGTDGLADAALQRLDPISMVVGWAQEVWFVTSTSRYGHQVLCSDRSLNVPFYSNFPPPQPSASSPLSAAPVPQCRDEPGKHTVAFIFTDGDSIAWDMWMFMDVRESWWASPERGRVPIAWTFQPMLQELHPWFLEYVRRTASVNDTIITGPSGAGYTYLDQYPSAASRAAFAEWTAASTKNAGFVNMVNQIQNGVFDPRLEAETVSGASEPPIAIIVDEYFQLTLKGHVKMLNKTVVTARRHALSKTFGDLPPESLVEALSTAPTDRTSETGYSLVGVEVWGYGVKDVVSIVKALNASNTRVVGIEEYVQCLRQHVLEAPRTFI